jgi:hypothetical protein
MFIVFAVDEDGEQLAVRHTQSKLTVVFQVLGTDNYEPLYGLKEVIGFKDPEVIGIPSCFEPMPEILIALKQWQDSGGEVDTLLTDEDEGFTPITPPDNDDDDNNKPF